MDKNKRERLKNWLESGISESDSEKKDRNKKQLEAEEKLANLIRYGKNKTDFELIDFNNLENVMHELLNRLFELKQIEKKEISKEKIKLVNRLIILVGETIDYLSNIQDEYDINFKLVNKKIELFNIEFEKFYNFRETGLKESNKERQEREHRIKSAPSKNYSAPLTPRDKDY